MRSGNITRLPVVVILVLYILIQSSCMTDADEKNQPDPEPVVEGALDVLFVGSSYFSCNDLPALVRGLVEAAGKEINISTEIINGRYLDYHAGSTSTHLKIQDRDWDYIFLQGGCTEIAYPDPGNPYSDTSTYHPLFPALVALEKIIHENCESTKMVFFMPWAFEDGMTWTGFPEETYEVMQDRIIEHSLDYAGRLDIILTPVGVAFKTILVGLGCPLHYLHNADWNHPSMSGSYLAACVIYASIYKESASGIEFYGGIDEKKAQHFQVVGSATVLDDLEKWKLE